MFVNIPRIETLHHHGWFLSYAMYWKFSRIFTDASRTLVCFLFHFHFINSLSISSKSIRKCEIFNSEIHGIIISRGESLKTHWISNKSITDRFDGIISFSLPLVEFVEDETSGNHKARRLCNQFTWKLFHPKMNGFVVYNFPFNSQIKPFELTPFFPLSLSLGGKYIRY